VVTLPGHIYVHYIGDLAGTYVAYHARRFGSATTKY